MRLDSSASLWLGITFVGIGAVNVWLVLQASASVKNSKASPRWIAAHRVGGYLFIALFCVMAYFMVSRLDDGGSTSPGTVIHLTLAMILSPLLFVKVLVARYYKNYYGLLMPVGLAIFVLSFVLVGITAGPSLARHRRMQMVAVAAIDLPPTAMDMDLAAATMQRRCSKCHNLDRVVGARKDARGWLATVNRMRALPNSGIAEEEARTIVSYLAFQLAPGGSAASASLEVGRAAVDQRCGRCHALDRVYKTAETADEWGATVARMASYAAGSSNAFSAEETEQIVAYLAATQTPDAMARRKAAAVASAGHGTAAQPTASAVLPALVRTTDGRALGFIAFVCAGAITLISRRPGRNRSPGAAGPRDVASSPAPAALDRGPLILKLALIIHQTPDSKTLRFVLPPGRKLSARPGQFLTFGFLFDGKKVTRSYSICSSAARTGYLEITPKRVSQGCVSVFLNDRATVGMTVEANGPFGHFCFDEHRHRNVVLLAAGSGITPMIAMLRYMDDLCLTTAVTLLYCVRTSADIMFRAELEGLRGRLQFQYQVMLSQPDAGWAGARGHVSREFVEAALDQPEMQDFFLCGPPSFMKTTRAVLLDLGVKPERILQESFGSPAAAVTTSGPEAAGRGAMVEFARSGKTCMAAGGQTLLEAAEQNGIGIPYGCRQGQCGTCKTKLLDGSVRMSAEDGLDPDSKAQGYVLTCVGRADGAVRLDA
jgi:ferredoxin-NADP reductase/mono/diheme cytochrome c family protein